MQGALSHLRVIDLTHYISGPYCTKLMAGFGAAVIKIERPETGDKMRSRGPFYKNEVGIERSIPFLWLNTGKKSITLDLKSGAGKEILKDLVRNADVLVENFSPGVMARLGLSYEVLREINPRLVMTSISNFGQTGPYRDFKADEITLYALSGQMYMTGDPSREPLTAGPAICQYLAGLHAYAGTLIALFRREADGEGQHVDVSIHESGIESIEMTMMNQLRLAYRGKRHKHPMVPWDLYSCRDGYAAVICGPMRNWHNGAGLFEEQKLFDDKFGHVFERAKYREEVESLIQPWLDRHRKEDVFHAGQRKGLAFGYLASFQEVFASPQHEARSFFLNIDHPVVGEQKYCGAPFRLTVTPWQKVRAPLLGEHTEEVFHKLRGASPAKADTVRGERGTSAGAAALKGVKILDFTHSWAGPHAVRVLADFGADVVRIEYVKRLCALRGARTENEHYNKHPMWFHVNRGKLSLTLDIKNRNDRSIVYELVKMSDVVIDNARGGVMERLGLGYDDLIKIKPNVVLVSMASFGKTGPYATYAGYGATMEVVGGVQNLTAYAPDGKPRRIKEVDVINGIVAAGALMTALLHYQRTGQGQWVDMSQLESVTHALIGEHLLEFACNGTQQLPLGNRHRWLAPQGCYKCKGDDRWVTLVVRTDEEWHAFCDLLKHPEWKTDAGLSTSANRAANHDALDRLIEAWTSTLSHYEAMHLLQEAGIASGAVLDVEDLSKDAHLKEREYFLSSADGVPGLFPGMPIRLSRTPGTVRWKGPDLGQHNEFIVGDLLGRPRAEIPTVDVKEIGTAYDSA